MWTLCIRERLPTTMVERKAVNTLLLVLRSPDHRIDQSIQTLLTSFSTLPHSTGAIERGRLSHEARGTAHPVQKPRNYWVAVKKGEEWRPMEWILNKPLGWSISDPGMTARGKPFMDADLKTLEASVLSFQPQIDGHDARC